MVSKRKEMIDNDIQYPNGTSGQTTRANNSKSITHEEHTLQWTDRQKTSTRTMPQSVNLIKLMSKQSKLII